MKKFEELTLTEVQAMAYQEIVKMEQSRKNLDILNARINELSQTPPEGAIIGTGPITGKDNPKK